MSILVTDCNGIIQADMILKTAIEAGIMEIIDNPWLLDFCLQFYLKDDLTQKVYGAKQIEAAKAMLLNTNIDVRLDVAATQAEEPTVTITVAEGNESWTTLGDVHGTPVERLAMDSIMARDPALTFTPKSFDAATGTIVLNEKLNTNNVWPNMRVLDTVNSKTYVITDVIDDQTFVIDSNPAAPPNLKRAQVVNASDLWVVSLESATHRESYHIACECQGDPINTIALHSMILFILYRYKNDFLHKRGFENVVIAKSGLTGPYAASDVQLFFKRGISVTGHVTHTWPGEIRQALQGAGMDLSVLVEGSGKTYEDNDEGEPGLEDQGWRVVDPDLEALGDDED